MNAQNRAEHEVANTTKRSTRVRVLIFGAVLPVLISVIAALVMVSWLPELPNPIATHWGVNGVNGYGPAALLIFLPLGITLLFSLFATGGALGHAPGHGLAWTQKFLVVTSIWLSTMLSVGIAGSLALQRGLKDASSAGEPGTALAVGAAVGLVLAVVAWFLLPKTDSSGAQGVTPPAVALAQSERVSWSRTVSASPVVFSIVGITMVVALGASLYSLLAAEGGVWTALLGVLLVVLVASTTTIWRVSVDRRGLTVRSVFGWPRVWVPLDAVASVQVVTVNPSADFGGWGFRMAPGRRTGIIMRAGDGIEVTRTNGKRFVVTVDDAATGAGVLAALAAQGAKH